MKRKLTFKFYTENKLDKDLYNLARSTFDKIKADMENGDNINPGRLNQMINLIEAMFKSHKTEQILGFYKNQQPSEPNTEIDFDELLIEEFLEMLE